MGWLGRRLMLLLLFSSLGFASSFSDCYSPQPLERFWEQPSYFDSNQYVSNLGIFKFYSYSFDNSTQSLGLENLSLASQEELYSAIPEKSRREFSLAASSLEAAQSSLIAARDSASRAHRLSAASQEFASSVFSQNQLMAMSMPYPLSNLASAYAFLKAQDVSQYVVFYPLELSAVFSQSANAYDSAQKSAHEAARLADREMGALSFAGAGKAHYSGKAKGAYYHAQEMLSSKTGCPADGSSAIRAYFSSRPALPDFSSTNFSSYLKSTAGAGGNSSLAALAAAYAELSAALDAMREEYALERKSALESQQELSANVQSLESERLELIAPGLPSSTEQGISVGSGFSGLYQGVQMAKGKLSASKTLLAASESSFRSESYQGYLSDAIELAHRSFESSESASESAGKIMENARAAVQAKREDSWKAISLAENSLPSSANFYGSQAREQSLALIGQAKEKYLQAGQAQSLGQQFSLYSEAASLAGESLETSKSSIARPAQALALKQLQAFSGLLDASVQDGLDVDYERGRLEQYRQLLATSYSPEAIAAISQAAADDEKWLLARLAGRYGGLHQDFLSLGQEVREIRASDSEFMPEYDALEDYFTSAGLNLPYAAGKLSYLQGRLAELSKKAGEKKKQHLSFVLSKNARVYETAEPPMLGNPTAYRALITTENPGTLEYNGSIAFSAKTSSQLFLQDLSGASNALDVYPEGEKTTILLPSLAPGEKLSFLFSRSEQPAQILSLAQSCSQASSSGAKVSAKMDFVSARGLQTLRFRLPASTDSVAASASYLGLPANHIQNTGDGWLEGAVGPVEKGKGELDASYIIARPFTAHSASTAIRNIGAGSRAVSYVLTIDSIAADCEQALVSWPEPYSGILNLSVMGRGSQKVSGARAAPNPAGSSVEFAFSPISKGSTYDFDVSFVLFNASEALEYAFAQAELSAEYSNNTRGRELLKQARLLEASNRTDEALLLLDGPYRASASSYSGYFAYQEASSTAKGALSSAAAAQVSLQKMNATAGLASLSKAIAALEGAGQSADLQASQGEYGKAAQVQIKGVGDFRLEIAAMAWKAAQEASEGYSKARAGGAQDGPEGQLQLCEQQLQQGNSLFAQGEPLQAFLSFSYSKAILDSISSSSAQADLDYGAQAEQIAAQSAMLRSDADELLSAYSQQYSGLSAQGKRKMPLTPSEAQSKLDSAQKKLDAAMKAKAGAQMLSQANASYQALQSASQSMRDSLSLLNSSAKSSLKVAKIALQEVLSKASESEREQAAQIESEVARAEELYSNSMFGDSIASSDRAIAAANTFLSGKSQPSLDAKSIALGGISLLFVLAATYYFWARSGRQKPQKKEKKEIPKAV